MSDIVKMPAEIREGTGKGAARAVRRAGYVPAVIYGGNKDPLCIKLKGNELLKTLKQGGFYTTVFEIETGSGSERVLPKAIQKNIVNGLPEHVDFLRLTKGASIVVEVPVEFVNEDISVGLKKGGVLNVVRHTVELEVPADAIPDTIQIDIAEFDLGDGIHISHVSLPEGARVTITDRDFTIATIAAPSGLKSRESEAAQSDGEEAEAAAAAEKGEAEE